MVPVAVALLQIGEGPWAIAAHTLASLAITSSDAPT